MYAVIDRYSLEYWLKVTTSDERFEFLADFQKVQSNSPSSTKEFKE